MFHRPLVSPGFYLGHKYTKRFNSANMSLFRRQILSLASRDAFTRVLRRGPSACPGGGRRHHSTAPQSRVRNQSSKLHSAKSLFVVKTAHFGPLEYAP
jgi:hypothetical protein